MATGFEQSKCCLCGKLATCGTFYIWADPEGPQFWCDEHEPGRKPTCSNCRYWRDSRCTNATILDFVKNDPNAIVETPPDFSCHLHERAGPTSEALLRFGQKHRERQFDLSNVSLQERGPLDVFNGGK